MEQCVQEPYFQVCLLLGYCFVPFNLIVWLQHIVELNFQEVAHLVIQLHQVA